MFGTWRIRSLLERVTPSCSVVPSRWWRFLVKRWWFRRIFITPIDPELRVEGEERKVPFTYGPPLKDSNKKIEKEISEYGVRVTREIVAGWRGRLSTPLKRSRWRRKVIVGICAKKSKVIRSGYEVMRLWFTPALELIKERYPDMLDHNPPTWIADQPNLQWLKKITVLPYLFAPYLEGEWIRDPDNHLSPN
jgi:hypothetical protein